MHNYCLAKQIHTVDFRVVWTVKLLTGSLSVSLAVPRQCVMCCDAGCTPTLLTEQQMDWDQWLVMEGAPLKAPAGGFLHFVLLFLVCFA